VGEITEMILDGTLCQICGVFMGAPDGNDDFEPPGHPQTCAICAARAA
jgi:hypothetical protein